MFLKWKLFTQNENYLILQQTMDSNIVSKDQLKIESDNLTLQIKEKQKIRCINILFIIFI